MGMEIFEQVPKVDAVIVPAAGQYGLLASTAAAIKHLNSQILVIVSTHKNSDIYWLLLHISALTMAVSHISHLIM